MPIITDSSSSSSLVRPSIRIYHNHIGNCLPSRNKYINVIIDSGQITMEITPAHPHTHCHRHRQSDGQADRLCTSGNNRWNGIYTILHPLALCAECIVVYCMPNWLPIISNSHESCVCAVVVAFRRVYRMQTRGELNTYTTYLLVHAREWNRQCAYGILSVTCE